MQPIGYFTSCPEGQQLARIFGDYDLGGLSQLDQTALVLSLASYVYQCKIGYASDVRSGACAAIAPDDDHTSPVFEEVLNIVNDISLQDAIGMIAFLTQGV